MGPSSELLGSWVEVFPAIPAEWLPRQVTDSSLLLFQGFFVSVFYCFFNGEVGDQAPRQSSVPSPVEPPSLLGVPGSLALLSSALGWGGEGRRNHQTLGNRNPARGRGTSLEGHLCRLETIGQPLTKALGELGEQRSPGCRVSQKREARAQLVTGEDIPGASQV